MFGVYQDHDSVMGMDSFKWFFMPMCDVCMLYVSMYDITSKLTAHVFC